MVEQGRKVEFEKAGPRTLACVDRKGEPGKVIGPAFGALFAWAGQKGVAPTGAPLGIYHDSPEDVPVDELRMTIAIPVAPGTKGEGEIRVEDIPEREEAVLVHKGPYSTVGASYGALMGGVFSSGRSPAGPPMEVYISDPNSVPEAELLTELRIPVRKA